MNIFIQTYNNYDSLLNSINNSEEIEIGKKVKLINDLIQCKYSKFQDFINTIIDNIPTLRKISKEFDSPIFDDVCKVEIIKPLAKTEDIIKSENYKKINYIFKFSYLNNDILLLTDNTLTELYKVDKDYYFSVSMFGDKIYVHNDTDFYYDIINIVTKDIVRKENIYNIEFLPDYNCLLLTNYPEDYDNTIGCVGLYDMNFNVIIEPIHNAINIILDVAICYSNGILTALFNLKTKKLILKGNYNSCDYLNNGFLMIKSTDGTTTIYDIINDRIVWYNTPKNMEYITSYRSATLLSIKETNNKYSLLSLSNNTYLEGISDTEPIVRIDSNYIICSENNKVKILHLDGTPLNSDKLNIDMILEM